MKRLQKKPMMKSAYCILLLIHQLNRNSTMEQWDLITNK